MGNLINDIRYAVRVLLKRPGFSAIAILTLALGIGANSAIFTVVNGVLLRPLPFTEPQELITAWGDRENSDAIQVISLPDLRDWQAQTQTLSALAAHTSSGALIYTGDEPERIVGQAVSAEMFDVLKITPVMGHAFTREDDQPNSSLVTAISYELWQSRFNSDPQIIGKQLNHGSRTSTVVAVLPPGFKYPAHSRRTDFLQPLAAVHNARYNMRSSSFVRVVGRLKPGMDIEQAASEMRLIGQRLEQQYPDEGLRLGLTMKTLHEATVGSYRRSLLLLLGAVGVVLLIACTNIANLLLARAATRRKEIALRSALGASRARIVRQSLVENLVLSIAGGTLGLLCAVWGVDLLVKFSPVEVPRLQDVGIDARVFAFTAGVSVLTGLLFGLVPAFRSVRLDLNRTLKEGSRESSESAVRSRLRSLLVVSEVALSVVLLIGAGLLIKSMVQLRGVNPGFNSENVLVTSLSLSRAKYPKPEQQLAAFREILTRAQSMPGVASAGLIDIVPFGGTSSANTFLIEGQPLPSAQDKPISNRRTITEDYFKAMGIPVLAGRAFNEHDSAKAPPVIIINQSLARKYFANGDAIGKRITIEVDPAIDPNPPAREIVGIVTDVKHESLEHEAGSEFYVPFLQDIQPSMNLITKTRPGNSSVGAALRETIRHFDRTQYIPKIEPLNDWVNEAIAPRRFNTALLVIFAIVALILASIGVYGVLSYSVSQRTHEIGVRMALGAQLGNVFKLIVGEGMLLVLIGEAVGLAAALASTRLMSRLLFGVSATDPLTFAGVAVLLGTIAFVACLLPARRATRVDPLVALRYE